jgi:hypothetical protein
MGLVVSGKRLVESCRTLIEAWKSLVTFGRPVLESGRVLVIICRVLVGWLVGGHGVLVGPADRVLAGAVEVARVLSSTPALIPVCAMVGKSVEDCVLLATVGGRVGSHCCVLSLFAAVLACPVRKFAVGNVLVSESTTGDTTGGIVLFVTVAELDTVGSPVSPATISVTPVPAGRTLLVPANVLDSEEVKLLVTFIVAAVANALVAVGAWLVVDRVLA